jgi:glycosyltransferase involved in cell wall biosynthesis
MRPKVLLAVDRLDWAFAHIANRLVHSLSDSYDFEIKPYREVVSGTYDAVVAFWWGSACLLKGNTKTPKMILCVYDGYSWCTDIGKKQLNLACNQSASIAFANQKFLDIFPFKTAPAFLIEDGVDTNRFKPTSFPEKFTVGWTGNSSVSKNPWLPKDLKGVEVIKAACAKANIPLVLADRKDGLIPFDKMPDWYSKISAYVCASVMEGTPNPVLEAMSSGKPVITTDVGLVDKIVNHKNGMIITRDVNVMAEALIKMSQSDYIQMGKEARVSAEQHDWDKKIHQWHICLQSTLG